mgnify:CR=1 FL=1
MRTPNTPTYLLKRPCGYYFRYQIPLKHRLTVGCNEIQLPLYINDIHIAQFICSGMALILKKSLGTPMSRSLTRIHLKHIALEWKSNQLESIEQDKINSQKLTVETQEQELESTELLLSDVRESFALNNYSGLTDNASDLLKDKTHDASDIHQLSYELAATRISALEQQIRLLKGQPINLDTSSQQSFDPSQTTTEQVCISEAFSSYSAEKLRNKDWNDKTHQEQQYSIFLLQSLLNDKAVSAINKADIRNVKDSLAKLPKNTSKGKRFEGLSILEIIKLGTTDDLISATRVNHHLRLMSGFLGWCKFNGYMTDNPVPGMIPKRKRNARDERKQFDDADVLAVLNHHQVSELTVSKPHQYWLPRLGMYTGARLEELCQLHTGDIKQLNGIYYIDINDSRSDQDLKNLQSPRLIPLHQSLIGDGFITYISQSNKANADGLIFAELSKTKGKYSHNVSKWFSRVAKNAGLEQGKTFHSYRHTMADKLRDIEAQDYVIKRILGHSTQSETHDRYRIKTWEFLQRQLIILSTTHKFRLNTVDSLLDQPICGTDLIIDRKKACM